MRVVTERVAADPGGWDEAKADEVQQLFDGMASEWNERYKDQPHRVAPLEDGLARGEIRHLERCLDLGSGTGVDGPLLVERFDEVVAVDLSFPMLSLAPPHPPRVQGDGSRLPFTDATFDVIVLFNALLFPVEMGRVLAADGTLLWISAVGADTPIYLPADGVADALPGEWSGLASEAGDGTWAALQRA
jgi:ubiquinone/menaquinone biosynthesis C-methylase UbiE